MWMTSHCSLWRGTDAVVASLKKCHLELQTWWDNHQVLTKRLAHQSSSTYYSVKDYFMHWSGGSCVWCGGCCVICCFILVVGWLLFVKYSVWEQLNCISLYRMISASFVFVSNQPIGWQDCKHANILFLIRMWCWRMTFPHPWSLLPAVVKQFTGVLVSSWNFLWQCSFQVFP